MMRKLVLLLTCITMFAHANNNGTTRSRLLTFVNNPESYRGFERGHYRKERKAFQELVIRNPRQENLEFIYSYSTTVDLKMAPSEMLRKLNNLTESQRRRPSQDAGLFSR